MSDTHGYGTVANDSHGHDAHDSSGVADSHGGGHGEDSDERPHRIHGHAHAHDDHAPVEESAVKVSGSNSWWALKFDETTCFSLLGYILSWSVLDWGNNGERKKVDLILK